MSKQSSLNRRTFLKSAGMTALAGALGTSGTSGTAAAAGNQKNASGAYNFDEVYDRVGTDCYKWDLQIDRFGRENIVVPMGIADMDFRTAPVVTDALIKRVKHENWGYLSLSASYKDSICNWNKSRHNVNIDPKLLLNSTGVLPAIHSALRAFAPPGSKVIVQAPVYASFYWVIDLAHCRTEESPMKQVDGRYVMDFEDLERRIDHDTNVLILCNPHNPTGNCWSAEDLRTLGEICTRRRVVVFADEIHCDFVNKGNTYTPYCNLDDEAIVRNSITFNSTSKSFNLAATKCAYMFSDNPEYIGRIMDAGHVETVNTLGIVASEAAYNEGGDWLDQCVDYIDGNMDFAQAFIESEMPLVKWTKPEGTYLAWLDMTELSAKIGAAEMAAEANKMRQPGEAELHAEHMVEKFLVENAGVQLNDGYRYGFGGNGYMRMNLATSRQLLEAALRNIAAATSKA